MEGRYESLYREMTEGEAPPPMSEMLDDTADIAIRGGDSGGDSYDAGGPPDSGGALSPTLAAEIEALKRELDAELELGGE
jgi:hypothetical protein